MPQIEHIEAIGRRPWSAADTLRADSNYASNEYSLPVMGLAFLSRWRVYTYDGIIARDKASLDIFWLRDESLEDSANLPDPNVLAAEIIEDLQSALEELQAISDDLAQPSGAQEGGGNGN